MTSIKENQIEKIAYKAGCNGSIHYREIYELQLKRNPNKDIVEKYKVKIEIDTDESNPKEAKIFVLDKNCFEWKVVYTIPAKLLKTKVNQYNYGNNCQSAVNEFKADAIELKEKLYEIL